MNKNLSLFAFLSAIAINSPAYAVPFVPDDVPRCDNSINRGAQSALDLHMTIHSRKELENNKDYTMERLQNMVKQDGDETKIADSTMKAIIEGKEIIDESARFRERQNTLYGKINELQSYATKKYKCILILFYEQHKQTKTSRFL
jgi:hypothetical protein